MYTQEKHKVDRNGCFVLSDTTPPELWIWYDCGRWHAVRYHQSHSVTFGFFDSLDQAIKTGRSGWPRIDVIIEP